MIRTLKRQGTSSRAVRPTDGKTLRVECLEARCMLNADFGISDHGLVLSEPTGHAIFQRDGHDLADVAVVGTVTGIDAVESATRIEARAVAIDGFAGDDTEWTLVDDTLTDGRFAGSLTVSAGWYAIEVRAWDTASPIVQASVEQVGVGEIFVTAGQSNSANYSPTRLTPDDARVSAFGPDGWQPAADPQPIADGTGGSPWPALGDRLAEQLDVPIGFLSVGVGGTQVADWLPEGDLYPRLENALETLGPDGFRAVLWHQGEYDNYYGTSTAEYATRLGRIIETSRIDAGWDVPWGVALVGYLPSTYDGGSTDGQAAVVAAQMQIIDADSLVFQGASTDDLTDASVRRSDGHLTEAGLREHAARWVRPISTLIADTMAEPVDPRLAEALDISPDGTQIIVQGTAGNDTFRVSIGPTNVLAINGIEFTSDRMTRLSIVGGGGFDRFEMTGTDADESAVLKPFSATISGNGHEVRVDDVASITLHGGGGNDSALFEDSAGNDDFVGAPRFGRLEGDGFSNTVRDFGTILAEATAGGINVAKLFDSPGDDHLVTTPVYACLYGDGFRLQVEHFHGAHAYAGAGGVDEAKLFDSTGNDTFYADPIVTAIHGDGYFHRTKFFEGVHAYATSGGIDTADLYDSTGDDIFYSTPTSSALFGDGFFNRPKFFEHVRAHGGAGGSDRAMLFDSPEDDRLTAEDDWAQLANEISTVWLARFEQVDVEADGGGDNRAHRTAVDYLLRLTGNWQ